jgi:hypothetical protein
MRKKANQIEKRLEKASETVGGRPYCGEDDRMSREKENLRERADVLENEHL